MIKALFSSIFIHILIVGSIAFVVSKSVKRYDNQIKKISLTNISIKSIKPIKKVIEKKEKSIDFNKKTDTKKPKNSVEVAKKRVIKKRVKKENIRNKNRVERKKIKKNIVKKSIVKKTKKQKHIKKSPKKLKVLKKVNKAYKVKKSYKKVSNSKFIASKYLKLNKNRIYKAIQRAKSYPVVAKRLNIQGVVNVSFTILPTKKVVNIKTSGADRVLQNAAKNTIIKASSNFPRPKGRVEVTLNISYNLR